MIYIIPDINNGQQIEDPIIEVEAWLHDLNIDTGYCVAIARINGEALLVEMTLTAVTRASIEAKVDNYLKDFKI